MRMGTPQIANLPIKVPTDTQQKEIEKLVDRILELNKRIGAIRNASSGERDELLREIKRTDVEIDQKVCELYGLTEEEIKIVKSQAS